MHPALSVIFFTVVSGCGYGVLCLLGISLAFDAASLSRTQALVVLGAGAAMAAAGLTSSTLHLGQPLRAWRAFSQWRSSWLSREGIAALASFVPIAVVGACLWFGCADATLRIAAMLLAALTVVTVGCTAQIYATLKTIPAWHDARVLPGYWLFALLGGALWWQLLCRIVDPAWASPRWLLALAPLAAIASTLLKHGYWRAVDTAPAAATIESATGLGLFGAVHSAERPHTEANYLTNEMGYVLARKHAARLRALALILFGALPLLLGTIALWLDDGSPVTALLCVVGATAAATAGIFVERWLFFAEAKHVVMLFYGPQRD
ncbi:MAG: DmsC/YnfH family molybdoenzyme membrane anchor subunit [Rudaea sp.]